MSLFPNTKTNHLIAIAYPPKILPYDQLDFFVENDRIVSFLNHHWPQQMRQTPEQMARAGFYCKRNKDWVACPFCLYNKCDWGAEENPFQEHYKASMTLNCTYVKSHLETFKLGMNKNVCCDDHQNRHTVTNYFKIK